MYSSFFEVGALLQSGAHLLLAALCIAVIVRVLWRPADVFQEPCCGGCSHGVADILSGRCPECGGAYAKVGITTPAMAVRMRASLPLALLAWSAMVLIGGRYLYGWLESRAWAAYSAAAAYGSGAGGKQTDSYSTEFTPWYSGVYSPARSNGWQSELPVAKEDFRISLKLTTTTDAGVVESGSCVMTLRKSGEAENFPLAIDLPGGGYTLKDRKGTEIEHGAGVDASVVERWFVACGLNTKSKPVVRAMADAAKIVKFAQNDPKGIETLGRSFTSGSDEGSLQSNGSTTSSGGMPAFAAAMPTGPSIRDMGLSLGVAGLIYLVGIVAIVWRHRCLLVRPLRAAKAA